MTDVASPAPDIPGLGPSDVVPLLRQDLNFTSLALSPAEMFVITRVDGQTSLEELSLATGLGDLQTWEIVRRLRDLGIVIMPSAEAQAQPAAPPAATVEPAPAAPEAPPAPAVDPCDLPAELRASIDELHARLSEMDLFHILGCEPGAARRELWRAYAERARVYHPDRYFGRNLGNYKPRLERIFAQVSAAFQFLQDDQRRAAYEREVRQERTQRDPGARHAGEAPGQPHPASRSEAPRAHTERRERAPDGPPNSIDPRRRPTREQPRAEARGQARPASRGEATQPGAPRRASPTGELPRAETGGQATSRAIATAADDDVHRARLRESRERRQRVATGAVQKQSRARAFYRQALELLRAGDSDGALSNLSLAATFDPESQEYADRLSELRAKVADGQAAELARRAEFEEQAARLDDAAALWARAAEARPRALYHCRASEAFLAIGDLSQAEEHAIRATEIEPGSARAHLSLARAYARAKRIDGARAEIEKALRIDSESEAARELLRQIGPKR
ncbi:MAG: DnaJ domain-containing protein [Myxococcota bacterium]